MHSARKSLALPSCSNIVDHKKLRARREQVDRTLALGLHSGCILAQGQPNTCPLEQDDQRYEYETIINL